MNSLFYHVALMKDYMPIISEQLRMIWQSDFLESVDNVLNICVVYQHKKDRLKFEQNLPQKKNVSIHYVGDVDEYEYPTIEMLYQKASSYSHIGYIHTKGVTSQWHQWRKEMMRKIVSEWKDCFLILKHVDICGYDFQWSQPLFQYHKSRGVDFEEYFLDSKFFFKGNFWWINSQSICSLPDISQIRHVSRFEAEMWVGLPSEVKSAFCLLTHKHYKV